MNVFLSAQTNNLHVVTRKIDKEFDLQKEKKLEIKAEKGVIQILPSKDNLLHVELSLTLKHNELAVAKKELSYVRNTLTQTNDEIILSNSIVLPAKLSDGGIQSHFIAEYLIHAPDNMVIEIINNFGEVNIENIKADISTKLEYCDLYVNNSGGKLSINTKIGDINLNHTKSDVNISSTYAVIKLKDNSGTISIACEYGSISSVFTNTKQNLKVKANATNIDIFNKNCNECNLNLLSKQGDIFIDNKCYIKSEKNYLIDKSQSKTKIDYETTQSNNNFDIETSYANISLN